MLRIRESSRDPPPDSATHFGGLRNRRRAIAIRCRITVLNELRCTSVSTTICDVMLCAPQRVGVPPHSSPAFSACHTSVAMLRVSSGRGGAGIGSGRTRGGAASAIARSSWRCVSAFGGGDSLSRASWARWSSVPAATPGPHARAKWEKPAGISSRARDLANWRSRRRTQTLSTEEAGNTVVRW